MALIKKEETSAPFTQLGVGAGIGAGAGYLGGNGDKKYVDKNAEGQREGNRRNVAAIITQGVIMANGGDVKKAIAVFDEIHAHLVKKDMEA